jgi:cell division protein FtsB
MPMHTAVPTPVVAVVPADLAAAARPADAERVAELERLLTLERARRHAMEQGLDRLSRRVQELTRENADLREGRAGAAS